MPGSSCSTGTLLQSVCRGGNSLMASMLIVTYSGFAKGGQVSAASSWADWVVNLDSAIHKPGAAGWLLAHHARAPCPRSPAATFSTASPRGRLRKDSLDHDRR